MCLIFYWTDTGFMGNKKGTSSGLFLSRYGVPLPLSNSNAQTPHEQNLLNLLLLLVQF